MSLNSLNEMGVSLGIKGVEVVLNIVLKNSPYNDMCVREHRMKKLPSVVLSLHAAVELAVTRLLIIIVHGDVTSCEGVVRENRSRAGFCST